VEILLYVGVFVGIGAVMYFADYRFGAPIYRRMWNLWHKNSLPEDVKRGFIVGRTTKERILPTALLTVLSVLGLHYFGERDVIMLLLKAAGLMLPGLLLGFLLTGLAMREGRTHTTADKVFETMDRIERGEVGLKDVTQGAFGGVSELGKKAFDAAKERLARGVVTPPKPTVAEEVEQSEPPPPVTPKRSFQETLNDYTKRR
jgi:hypothetical protein